MKRLELLIADLNEMGKKPFIGYGNPNADILIIGKECAEEDKELQEKFYSHNFEQWKESLNGHGFDYKCGGEPYDFESGNFHPINPFYKLEKKKQTGKREIGRAPSTYYYYQRLVDKIRARSITDFMNPDEKFIDFFNDCFITELSDICRKNDLGLSKTDHLEIKKHIQIRFDWMRKTNFFNQFKVVILACGPYAGAIKKDECLKKELFGDAKVYYCNQLSRWDKNLDSKIIPDIIKQNLLPQFG